VNALKLSRWGTLGGCIPATGVAQPVVELDAVSEAAVGFAADEFAVADYVVVAVAALQEAWQGVLAAVVEEDVVDSAAGIAVAGNAAGLVLEYERVFHTPSLGYCSSLVVAAEDIHCFAQPKASSAWNMGSPVERNSWRLARAIPEQDFAEEHIPMKNET
jgi:hypothetical protein